MTSTVNPSYAARAVKSPPPVSAEPVRYAKLPLAPVNASPVPHLTSLYHFDGKDELGDRAYAWDIEGTPLDDFDGGGFYPEYAWHA